MAPQFVKPYVKRCEHDAADAEAICEAVNRPTMRFVPIEDVEQQAALTLRAASNAPDARRPELLALAFMTSTACASATPPYPARIPDVVGRTRGDEAIRLTADLPRRGSVPLPGFDRRHQGFFDDWWTGLAALEPNLVVLKVPAIAPSNALSRGFIQFGMRRTTLEGGPRDGTFTVFTDVHVLVVGIRLPTADKEAKAPASDGHARILARYVGAFTAENGSRFLKVLASVNPNQCAPTEKCPRKT